MALFLSMYVLSFVTFLLDLFFRQKRGCNRQKTIELLLLYQLIFSLGCTSLLAFIGLSLLPYYIADYTNWPASPFEQELGNVNLAFGVLGILCIWYRGNFWLATILGFSIWILADGLHHLYEYFYKHNDAPGNIGINLFTDLLVPPFLLVLLYLYRSQQKPSEPVLAHDKN